MWYFTQLCPSNEPVIADADIGDKNSFLSLHFGILVKDCEHFSNNFPCSIRSERKFKGPDYTVEYIRMYFSWIPENKKMNWRLISNQWTP